MRESKRRTGVTAIVPAFNEAGRIGAVLHVLTRSGLFDEVVVVDDGSTDGTAAEAARFPVTLVSSPRNLGKGGAMELGVRRSTSPVLFFCDADIRNLSRAILEEVLAPVGEGLGMSVAVCGRRAYEWEFVRRRIVPLGGVRAVRRELWEAVPPYFKDGFRIETGLNFHARALGLGMRAIVFPELAHVIKERKCGLLRGAARRLDMALQVGAAWLRARVVDAPRLGLEAMERRAARPTRLGAGNS